ncbi:MAG: tetratricopeptide repeat protein [Leucobacter sp.]
MAALVIAKALKPIKVLTDQDSRWRVDLFLLRKIIDSGLIKQRPLARMSNLLADRLMVALSVQPSASFAIVRQLRRIGRLTAALESIEFTWETKAESSAAWSLACARVWYDTGSTWRGDIALSQAFEMDPNWTELYKEQARNRRSRGNMAPSIEAAARVLELDHTAANDREWSELIGSQLFDAGEYLQAIPHLEHSVGKRSGWEDWYRLGFAYTQLNDDVKAEDAYVAAADEAGIRVEASLRASALHLKWGNTQAALAGLRTTTAISKKGEAERLRLLVEGLLQAELTSEAIEVLSDVDPTVGLDTEMLQGLSYELAGKPAEALEAYENAVNRFAPRGAVARQREMRLEMRLARSASDSGDIGRAVNAWRNIDHRYFSLRGFQPEVSPDFATLVGSAQSALDRKDFGAASELLGRLSRSSSTLPNLVKVQWQLGNTLAGKRSATRL